MSDAPRSLRALVWVAAAAALTGCITPQVKPKESQAVLDARAHRDVPAPPSCAEQPLSAVSPALLGFGFNAAAFDPTMKGPLDAAVRWLGCHPGVPVAISAESDGHGPAAEQDQLARRRAEVARDYLTGQGIAADRIRLLARGAAAPGGEVFTINAQGRRW
jgi:outer membrane protein OmpA-like peptidoglycan-associated protein